MTGLPSETRLSTRRIRQRCQRRGAATVEFAMTAPFLMALLLGMVDVGQFANVGQAVSGASSFAAREAAKPTTDSVATVQGRVTAYLADRFPNLSSDTLGAATDITLLDGDGNVLSDGALGTMASGSPITLQVVFQFDSVRWLDGVGVGRGRTLQTTTVVRRE